MILRPLMLLNSRPQLYSWLNQSRNVRPTIKIGKDKFQLFLDVHQFNKDELRVKVRPEYVIIEGKQERKTRDGFVIRKFFRKFKLPDGCDPQRVRSELSHDGCLTITAPRQTCETTYPCETVIPITQTTEEKQCSEPFLHDVTIEKREPPNNKK